MIYNVRVTHKGDFFYNYTVTAESAQAACDEVAESLGQIIPNTIVLNDDGSLPKLNYVGLNFVARRVKECCYTEIGRNDGIDLIDDTRGSTAED